MEFGQQDLKVLSDMLADKPFFFGDEPTNVNNSTHPISSSLSLNSLSFVCSWTWWCLHISPRSTSSTRKSVTHWEISWPNRVPIWSDWLIAWRNAASPIGTTFARPWIWTRICPNPPPKNPKTTKRQPRTKRRATRKKNPRTRTSRKKRYVHVFYYYY